jgi:hypothetical protein
MACRGTAFFCFFYVMWCPKSFTIHPFSPKPIYSNTHSKSIFLTPTLILLPQLLLSVLLVASFKDVYHTILASIYCFTLPLQPMEATVCRYFNFTSGNPSLSTILHFPCNSPSLCTVTKTKQCILPQWVVKEMNALFRIRFAAGLRSGESFISSHIKRRELQEIMQIKLLSSDIFYSQRGVSCETS